MNPWQRFLLKIIPWIPVVGVLALSAFTFSFAQRFLFRDRSRHDEESVFRYAVLLGIAGSGLVAGILAMPVSDATHGQLLGFFGILISAAIALASTTLLGNAMAGVMMRQLRSFKPGDFVKVGDHFGRVTEIGVLHTEVQDEFRNLTTLPNIFLVQNPVTVCQAPGTIVSAIVSLGYDISRRKVEEALLEAARETGLTDPFVRILELGDHSITYRAAGFLEETRKLISKRSSLRGKMLDALHRRGIEIVSPLFLSQRVYPKDETFLHRPSPRPEVHIPDDLIFDKAEKAETRAQIKDTLAQLEGVLAQSELEFSETTNEDERAKLTSRRERLESLKEHLQEQLELHRVE